MKLFEYSDEELAELRSRDKKLAALIDRFGRIDRRLFGGIFETAVKNIAAQQISGAAFETIWKKIKNRLKKINPENILKTAPEELKSCGLSAKKTEYIQKLAQQTKNGEIDLKKIKRLSDEEAVRELTKIDGIGVWTAEMMLIFCLNRKNILSFGDLGIQNGLKKIYKKEKISREFFEQCRERFSPLGSIAGFYLWAANVPDKNLFYYESPAGTLTIVEQGNALTELAFGKKEIRAGTLCRNLDKNPVLKTVKKWLDDYFAGTPVKLPEIKFKPAGTPFEQAVWRELKKIKYGKTKTYGEIAETLARSRKIKKMSAQAVGNAVGKNPIALIFPCHRVLGTGGKLTGFSAGLKTKRLLLKIEQH